ncbi:hypothetical protein AB0K00_09975 [Dactylosporangium sp. NPDC049525]|uniref:hypothetical protein n=1 Tax=Dactylosporangium sp. NPDC049525 TaxID=3154730 RepID=UPI003423F9BF
MRAALTIAPLWCGGARSVVLRLDRLAGLAGVLDSSAGSLLDDVEGRLHPVRSATWSSGTVPAARTASTRTSTNAWPQLTHHQYLRRELAKGHAIGSTATMVLWDDLAGFGLQIVRLTRP